MELFTHWETLPVIHLPNMNRKIYHGEKVMIVRNEVFPNEILPSHSHPHEQLFVVESGECDVTTGEEVRHLTAGGLAWFPSDVPHAVTNTLDAPLVVYDIFSPIREDFLK